MKGKIIGWIVIIVLVVGSIFITRTVMTNREAIRKHQLWTDDKGVVDKGDKAVRTEVKPESE